MATTNVKWYGQELMAKITGTGESGLYALAEELLHAAKARAPKRTGTLQDSGYVATSKRSTYRPDKQHNKKKPVPEDVSIVAFAAFYAHMVENGTSKAAAKPFLRPALDEVGRRAGTKAVIVMRGKLK